MGHTGWWGTLETKPEQRFGLYYRASFGFLGEEREDFFPHPEKAKEVRISGTGRRRVKEETSNFVKYLVKRKLVKMFCECGLKYEQFHVTFLNLKMGSKDITSG